eukprot:1127975-Prymnesium_polylepis.1
MRRAQAHTHAGDGTRSHAHTLASGGLTACAPPPLPCAPPLLSAVCGGVCAAEGGFGGGVSHVPHAGGAAAPPGAQDARAAAGDPLPAPRHQ